jgi:hypothetical protein
MAKRAHRGLYFYLVDPKTGEVVKSYALSAISKAMVVAKAKRWQVVIASSVSQAEKIASGARPGPMFWPGKIHRGHAAKRRSSKRRVTRKNRRRTSRR